MFVEHASLTRSPVESEQDGESRVGVVEALGGEQKRAELGAIQATGLGLMDLGAVHVLRRVRRDAAVDVGESYIPQTVERRRPMVVAASLASSMDRTYNSISGLVAASTSNP